MRTTNTLILGGGQAGLAISSCLTGIGCDHLVVERGRIAERWHSERWNSLRLLTPNWMTRLPGWTYDGPEPDGFMTAPEVASFFAGYAASFSAPVQQHTTVQQVTSLVGRLSGVDGTRVTLATNLGGLIDAADRQAARVLGRIDAAIERCGLTAEVFDAEPVPPITPMSVPASLDLDAAGIRTIVWATGHRRPYPWLDLPILDRHGEICQYRGFTPVPGAYGLGQRFQHYRNSNFIDGVGRDAHYIAEHICRTRRQLTAVSTSPLTEQK